MRKLRGEYTERLQKSAKLEEMAKALGKRSISGKSENDQLQSDEVSSCLVPNSYPW